MTQADRASLARVASWGMNAALLVWVLEGLVLLGIVSAIKAGWCSNEAAQDFVLRWESPASLAQGAAGTVLVLGVLLRHLLKAEPLAPTSWLWLSMILSCVLSFSTFFLLVSIRKEFEGVLLSSALDAFYAVRLRQVSAQLGMLFSVGGFSALGLLVLHFLGAREERSAGLRRHRPRIVPPWRLPRTRLGA